MGGECTTWSFSEQSENIKRELATKELPNSLSALVNMCIRLDDHIREFNRRSGEGRRAAAAAGTSTGFPSLTWGGD